MSKWVPLCAVLGMLAGGPAARADVLLIEAVTGEPVNSEEGLPRPSRGMSMDRVRERYGEPVETLPWVGDPPITRWVYPDYTVYFEYQYVINTVVNP